jgi:pimeloyl-ACP methyl ester carboxylesterase
MPFFNRDSLNFHYLDRGTGTPFFFQHGLGGEVEKIFELIELPPGFRLLGLDCRAHGKTVPLGVVEKLGFDSFADDVIALMEHLEIPRAIVGGTSMGAGIALNCALRYPQLLLGLVLLRPAWLDGPLAENGKVFSLIAQLLLERGPEAGAEAFKNSTVYLSILNESSDSAESLLALFAGPRAVETVAKLERIPDDAPNRDRAEWRRISIPTLVLANRRDPIHPFEFGQTLAREIPHAQFAELTPKSIDLAKYTSDVRRHLAEFLQSHFGKAKLPLSSTQS